MNQLWISLFQWHYSRMYSQDPESNRSQAIGIDSWDGEKTQHVTRTQLTQCLIKVKTRDTLQLKVQAKPEFQLHKRNKITAGRTQYNVEINSKHPFLKLKTCRGEKKMMMIKHGGISAWRDDQTTIRRAWKILWFRRLHHPEKKKMLSGWLLSTRSSTLFSGNEDQIITCMSEVQRVRLSLRSCMIKVLSL